LESDPDSLLFFLNTIFLLQISASSFVVSIVCLLLLLMGSALISGSEVAYFSITPKVFQDLEEEKKISSRRIINLLEQPQKLLATILIANNFINIGIVILSDYILRNSLPENTFTHISQKIVALPGAGSFSIATVNRGINFLITVVGVTSILVFFGEISPKVYARINAIKIARMMSLPLTILMKVFSPISRLLVNWTNSIEKRLEDKSIGKGASSDELEEAIDLISGAEKSDEEETDLLKKIVRFGNVNISQIMRPRVDVVGLDANMDFGEVLKIIRESKYSRLPVYEENLDSIKGILHVKKLLKYLHKPKDFNWNQDGIIQRKVMFEPETKKISQLLRSFQEERKHMAIVVDEFGGTSGIVTMEDVLEEILGEIYDEFDGNKELAYKKINNNTYILEGKSFLIDVIKTLELPEDFFDDIKGEADTIAGIILENLGQLPNKNYKFTYKNIKFKVVDVDDRRIKKVQIVLPKKK